MEEKEPDVLRGDTAAEGVLHAGQERCCLCNSVCGEILDSVGSGGKRPWGFKKQDPAPGPAQKRASTIGGSFDAIPSKHSGNTYETSEQDASDSGRRTAPMEDLRNAYALYVTEMKMKEVRDIVSFEQYSSSMAGEVIPDDDTRFGEPIHKNAPSTATTSPPNMERAAGVVGREMFSDVPRRLGEFRNSADIFKSPADVTTTFADARSYLDVLWVDEKFEPGARSPDPPFAVAHPPPSEGTLRLHMAQALFVYFSNRRDVGPSVRDTPQNVHESPLYDRLVWTTMRVYTELKHAYTGPAFATDVQNVLPRTEENPFIARVKIAVRDTDSDAAYTVHVVRCMTSALLRQFFLNYLVYELDSRRLDEKSAAHHIFKSDIWTAWLCKLVDVHRAKDDAAFVASLFVLVTQLRSYVFSYISRVPYLYVEPTKQAAIMDLAYELYVAYREAGEDALVGKFANYVLTHMPRVGAARPKVDKMDRRLLMSFVDRETTAVKDSTYPKNLIGEDARAYDYFKPLVTATMLHAGKVGKPTEREIYSAVIREIRSIKEMELRNNRLETLTQRAVYEKFTSAVGDAIVAFTAAMKNRNIAVSFSDPLVEENLNRLLKNWSLEKPMCARELEIMEKGRVISELDLVRYAVEREVVSAHLHSYFSSNKRHFGAPRFLTEGVVRRRSEEFSYEMFDDSAVVRFVEKHLDLLKDTEERTLVKACLVERPYDLLHITDSTSVVYGISGMNISRVFEKYLCLVLAHLAGADVPRADGGLDVKDEHSIATFMQANAISLIGAGENGPDLAGICSATLPALVKYVKDSARALGRLNEFIFNRADAIRLLADEMRKGILSSGTVTASAAVKKYLAEVDVYLSATNPFLNQPYPYGADICAPWMWKETYAKLGVDAAVAVEYHVRRQLEDQRDMLRYMKTCISQHRFTKVSKISNVDTPAFLVGGYVAVKGSAVGGDDLWCKFVSTEWAQYTLDNAHVSAGAGVVRCLSSNVDVLEKTDEFGTDMQSAMDGFLANAQSRTPVSTDKPDLRLAATTNAIATMFKLETRFTTALPSRAPNQPKQPKQPKRVAPTSSVVDKNA